MLRPLTHPLAIEWGPDSSLSVLNRQGRIILEQAQSTNADGNSSTRISRHQKTPITSRYINGVFVQTFAEVDQKFDQKNKF